MPESTVGGVGGRCCSAMYSAARFGSACSCSPHASNAATHSACRLALPFSSMSCADRKSVTMRTLMTSTCEKKLSQNCASVSCAGTSRCNARCRCGVSLRSASAALAILISCGWSSCCVPRVKSSSCVCSCSGRCSSEPACFWSSSCTCNCTSQSTSRGTASQSEFSQIPSSASSPSLRRRRLAELGMLGRDWSAPMAKRPARLSRLPRPAARFAAAAPAAARGRKMRTPLTLS